MDNAMLEFLTKRTEARKKAGLIPEYPVRVVVQATTNTIPLPVLTCIHRGEPTGQLVGCQTCNGNVQLKTFACNVYGTCTLAKKVEGVPGCCQSCPDYKPVRPDELS